MSAVSPELPAGLQPVSGPERVGSEQRWCVRLTNGDPGRFAQLLPELARDESIRRRYVRDIERLRALDVEGLAPILDHGPKPDPRDPTAAPPWRVRADPRGETLEAWLTRRAPAPVDEVAELVARLAEVVHRVHAGGAVLRDLHPRWIVLGEDGGLWLTDVGLARVDILSTRTAASLILEGSPYASPEQLRRTTLDQRSDLFALGGILYEALTATLPFGEGPALLRDTNALLPVRALRPEIPPAMEAIVLGCLADNPTARPESAMAVVRALRGQGAPSTAIARVVCQNCEASLRLGQRICLTCGKLAVQFEHDSSGGQGTKELLLTKATEETDHLAKLRGFLGSVSDRSIPALDFVIGDQRMYSKTELARRIKLPVALFTDLDEATAEALRARMAAQGFHVKVTDKFRAGVSTRSRRLILGIGASVFAVGVGLAIATQTVAAISLSVVAAVGTLTAYLIARSRRKKKPRPAMLSLRAAPAALPASDPLVGRLAELLTPSTPDDVREHVGELALLVQRLVDHRGQLGAEKGELDMLTEPVRPLVTLIEAQVRALADIDAELPTLDEGTMVRALASSNARGEPSSMREDLLTGLDRLRALEERRASIFHRLLEASSLLRRSVDLGLGIVDEDATHARHVQLALRALGENTLDSD